MHIPLLNHDWDVIYLKKYNKNIVETKNKNNQQGHKNKRPDPIAINQSL